MDTDRGLQDVVSRNIRVLMAVHDIHSQLDLAARMGWDAPKLNKSLNGTRRWALEDLPAIADVFGIRPAALLSDTAELVGASHPARVSDTVSQGVSARYQTTNGATVIPFPQDRATRPRYAPPNGAPHPRRGYPANGVHVARNWHNERPVATVTAQVGS